MDEMVGYMSGRGESSSKQFWGHTWIVEGLSEVLRMPKLGTLVHAVVPSSIASQFVD